MTFQRVAKVMIFLLLLTQSLSAFTEWQQSEGPGCGIVKDILADGTNLFATSRGGGLFKSTDNAESWISVSDGLTNPYVISLGKSDNYLFAGTTNLYGGSGGGVYRSDNNGDTWNLSSNGLGSTRIFCITVDGSNVFVGTSDGVFLSTDEGSSWTSVNSGITNSIINDILCYNSSIFAATSGDGIFVSNDNGTSWTATNSGLTSLSVSAIKISGSNMFAATSGGMFLSVDNGANWTEINSGLTNIDITDIAVSGNNIYVGSYAGGVFVSNDNGSSWTDVSTGLSNNYIYCLEPNGNDLYAGTFGAGVYKTADNGTSWTMKNNGINAGDIRVFAENNDYLFVGIGGCGVFRSNDDGANWENAGLDDHWIYSLIAVPDGSGGSVLLAGTMGENIFRSTDNGDTWTTTGTGITVPLIWTLTMITINNEDIIFAGTYGGGVFYSNDLGLSWTGCGMVPGAPLITSIVYDGTNLYAASDASGVFKSTDAGNSWIPVTNGLTNTYVSSLLVDDNDIYAGTLAGLFKSSNCGNTWTDVTANMTSNGICCLLSYKDYIIAGCSSNAVEPGGVYFTLNSGSSWTHINEGLTNSNTRCLTIHGMNLFAGSYGGGIYTNPIVVPDIVQLTSPEDGAEVNSIVDFVWEESSPQVDQYWFEYSTDENFATSIIDSTINTTTTQVQFTESGQYWWKVKAKNAAGWGDFSDVRSFTTAIIPDIVQLTSPDNEAVVGEIVDFIWEESQPNINHYWFEYATDENFANSIIDSSLVGTTTQIQFDENDQYWWRVKAKNTAGWGDFSDVRSFTTAILPDIVQLTSPDNEAVVGEIVDFIWEESQPNINYYWFEYATDENFANSIIDSSLVGTTTQIQFDENDQYWWRVKAKNTAGWGEFSEVRSFTATVTGSFENPFLPTEFALLGNYPNPFNPTTSIKFDIAEETQVLLQIYNMKGQVVKTLVNNKMNTGRYDIEWNGKDDFGKSVASGTYFYIIKAADYRAYRKCILLK